jgi:multicomponent Na+:H+ antiporter subunit E
MTQSVVTAIAHRALLLGGAWVTLTKGEALALGVAVTAVAVWMSLRLLPATHPLVLWRLARHVPRFLVGSLVGGVDVAQRAFSPDMRLHPGWLEIPGDLPDGARVALGAEVSLMPGTLAAGSDDGKLLVHLLDTRAGYDSAIPREAEDIAAMIGLSPRTGA